MKKTTSLLRKALVTLGAAAMALSVLCCSNLVNESYTETEAYIVPSISEDASRTIFPSYDKNNLSKIVLSYANENSYIIIGSWNTYSEFSTSKVKLEVSEIEYKFKLEAYYGSTLFSGETTKKIEAGNNAVSFKLEIPSYGDKNDYGSIKFKLNFTKDIDCQKAKITLYKVDNSGIATFVDKNYPTWDLAVLSNPDGSHYVDYKRDWLSVGLYKIVFELTSKDNKVASYSNYIQLAKDFITSYEYDLKNEYWISVLENPGLFYETSAKHITLTPDAEGIKVTLKFDDNDKKWTKFNLTEKKSGFYVEQGFYKDEGSSTVKVYGSDGDISNFIPSETNKETNFIYKLTKPNENYIFELNYNLDKDKDGKDDAWEKEIVCCKANGGVYDTVFPDTAEIDNYLYTNEVLLKNNGGLNIRLKKDLKKIIDPAMNAKTIQNPTVTYRFNPGSRDCNYVWEKIENVNIILNNSDNAYSKLYSDKGIYANDKNFVDFINQKYKEDNTELYFAAVNLSFSISNDPTKLRYSTPGLEAKETNYTPISYSEVEFSNGLGKTAKLYLPIGEKLPSFTEVADSRGLNPYWDSSFNCWVNDKGDKVETVTADLTKCTAKLDLDFKLNSNSTNDEWNYIVNLDNQFFADFKDLPKIGETYTVTLTGKPNVTGKLNTRACFWMNTEEKDRENGLGYHRAGDSNPLNQIVELTEGTAVSIKYDIEIKANADQKEWKDNYFAKSSDIHLGLIKHNNESTIPVGPFKLSDWSIKIEKKSN